jgi:hypothetical protein
MRAAARVDAPGRDDHQGTVELDVVMIERPAQAEQAAPAGTQQCGGGDDAPAGVLRRAAGRDVVPLGAAGNAGLGGRMPSEGGYGLLPFAHAIRVGRRAVDVGGRVAERPALAAARRRHRRRRPGRAGARAQGAGVSLRRRRRWCSQRAARRWMRWDPALPAAARASCRAALRLTIRPTAPRPGGRADELLAPGAAAVARLERAGVPRGSCGGCSRRYLGASAEVIERKQALWLFVHGAGSDEET